MFLFCLFHITLFIFDVFHFGHLFRGHGSFANEVHVLEVGVIENGGADCRLELLFAFNFLVHRHELL